MRDVALPEPSLRTPDAETDLLTLTMQTLRRVDRGGLRELLELLASRPRLVALLPGIAVDPLAEALQRIHRLAMQLAREQAVQALLGTPGTWVWRSPGYTRDAGKSGTRVLPCCRPQSVPSLHLGSG